jgi:hypothetical protein
MEPECSHSIWPKPSTALRKFGLPSFHTDQLRKLCGHDRSFTELELQFARQGDLPFLSLSPRGQASHEDQVSDEHASRAQI